MIEAQNSKEGVGIMRMGWSRLSSRRMMTLALLLSSTQSGRRNETKVKIKRVCMAKQAASRISSPDLKWIEKIP